MSRWPLIALAIALAPAGCLSSPPDSTAPSIDADPDPGPELRVLGVFSRDAYSRDSVNDDLILTAAWDDDIFLIHLRARDSGLVAVLEAAEADLLPFEPTALVGADVNADNFIDAVATSSNGDLAVLASQDDGLVAFPREVVLDSGLPFQAVTTIDAPDLAGEERIFLLGPQGIWMSDPLSDTDIHFDEINPRLTDVPLPASFFATHDDLETWYIGLASGAEVDLWPLSGFDRQTKGELIGYQTVVPPELTYWRRLPSPARIDFFAVLPAETNVIWVSEEFGASESQNMLDTLAGGPIRGLTVVQQPGGHDLLTVSEEPEGAVGVQVTGPLATPADGHDPPVRTTLSSIIDTGLPFWIEPLEVSATPFAGKELLVFDQAGHVLCVTFDAARTELSSCGEAYLGDYMDGWTGG